MLRLHKLSGYGWVQDFDSEFDAALHMIELLCRDCLFGSEADLDSLLATPCGAEYTVEYLDASGEPVEPSSSFCGYETNGGCKCC